MVGDHGREFPPGYPLQEVVSSSEKKKQWREERTNNSRSVRDVSGECVLFHHENQISANEVDLHCVEDEQQPEKPSNDKVSILERIKKSKT